MIDEVLDRSAAERRVRAARDADADPHPRRPGQPRPPLILFVDGALPPIATLQAIATLADRLERTLRLVGTLGDGPEGLVCPDPVDREIARRTRLAELDSVAERLRRDDRPVESRVIERVERDAFVEEGLEEGAEERTGAEPGPAAAPLLAFLRDRGELPWHADPGARAAVENGASVMIVPRRLDTRTIRSIETGPERILVPVDGSARAELAVTRALRLARRGAQGGAGCEAMSVVLAHVAPTAPVTRIDPPDAEALALARRLDEHNRRAAIDYLATLMRRHADEGGRLATRLLEGNAPRALLEAVSDGDIDLVVMAMSGSGGHVDVPAGSVALHLAAHVPVPVLLIATDGVDAAGTTPSTEPADALPSELSRRPEPPAGHG